MKVIEFYDVSFSYNSSEVLSDLNLGIGRGEFVAVLGPNGAGKSTMLRLILGLLKPTKGTVKVLGYNAFDERDKFVGRVGYLPQREEILLEAPLTVSQVIKLPLLARGKKVGDSKLREALSMVGLDGFEDKLFSELSGGQQQKVLLARALISDPEILLLDEPFNGVDVPSQEKIVEVLAEMSSKGKTVVAVVHNINPLLHNIDRVVLLNRRIIAAGKPNEVFSEENIIKAYGTSIPIVICEEGFTHPLYGDYHG
ncbi:MULTISPECIES: metal ABC transporter ATP-binding protein [Archaeoglobus]|jgi:ABC-type Mn2+/Zn2+ transport system ATPase subunit|uniref:ABC transporter, ATP-binding protein n=2 Tax=Archaeoglobus fulgidus TaxID=2234 RepID=A0A117KUD4_ARCFL|nr:MULTISPECIES: metal ABC transporter ATP-binding protein [Archaeoglobus]KUJ93968.1 MAG: ABC transporter, ATP-binding protein [Archaeoglobus fulgidus]KUK06490.1 MAG: ABC transporter, ATP-binding protein [Archaeoglobus fulgidus]MDI3497803.1 zinc/manganese transport system ATP-binding protein [Archaeoglobus sp.]